MCKGPPYHAQLRTLHALRWCKHARGVVGSRGLSWLQGPPTEFVEPFQETLPEREPLAFHPLPAFEHGPFQPAEFAPPCAPRPIGFLAGYAPLLLLDMSGTMHPSKGGRFFDMKVCQQCCSVKHSLLTSCQLMFGQVHAWLLGCMQPVHARQAK